MANVRVGYIGTEVIGVVLTKANLDKSPGGLIGYSSNQSNITATPASATPVVLSPGMSITITAGTNRLYSIYAGIPAITIGGGVTICDLCIYDNTLATVAGSTVLCTTAQAVGNWPGGNVTALSLPAAGSHQYSAAFLVANFGTTVQALGAASGNAARDNVFWIKDEGPSF